MVSKRNSRSKKWKSLAWTMDILNTAWGFATGLEVGDFYSVPLLHGCCLAVSKVPNAIFPSPPPTYPVMGVFLQLAPNGI